MLNEPLISEAAADHHEEQQSSHMSHGHPLPPLFPSSSSLLSLLLLLYLYLAHFLARWGARMWEFSVGLYMINVWPDSLVLAAAYGVVESASSALFGPLVGHLVDKFTYVKVLRLWLLSQNFSFMIAGCTVIALLQYEDVIKSGNFLAFLSLILFINISGAVGVLSTLAGTILVEREWAVVISEGQHPGVLTKMNATFRRIDLVCKLFAPVVTGFIISFVSLTASALTLAIWNVLSVCLQYWLLMSVYHGIPALGESSQKRNLRPPSANSERSSLIDESRDSHYAGDSELEQLSWMRKVIERVSRIPYFSAWKVYLDQQDVLLPGIALALLYFTVLSFGTLMTAALEWEGMPAYVIGIARGISATIGIAATFLYPVLESRLSTLRAGLWSIWSQWTCLLVCVASIWVRNRIGAAYLLMGGVALSRLGLWMFDLAVIQQMQDKVRECDRCVVGGVQNSMQSVLELTTYVMGVIISNPQEFWKLIILSLLVLTVAAVLYSIHIYRVRKHLFHFDKLYSLFRIVISFRPSN